MQEMYEVKEGEKYVSPSTKAVITVTAVRQKDGEHRKVSYISNLSGPGTLAESDFRKLFRRKIENKEENK